MASTVGVNKDVTCLSTVCTAPE